MLPALAGLALLASAPGPTGTICLLEAGDAEPARTRLQRITDDVRIVTLGESLSHALGECRVVVLPSGWAQTSWDAVAPILPALSSWVREGGALLVFQPNPHPEDRFDGGRLTVDLLDAPFTVDNWYVQGERSVRVAEHGLLEGVPDDGLPHPTDRIVTFESGPWTALVRGAQSNDASLLVGDFGEGRAAIATENPGTGSNARDLFLRNLLVWLTSRGG